MSPDEALKELGFSNYEARAYVALVRGGRLNGYETARAASLPRANVYPVLEKLVQRGAARRTVTRDGTRYAALAPEQLLKRIETDQQQVLAGARKTLAALAPASESAAVFNFSGGEELLVQARGLLAATSAALLAAVQPPEAAELAEALRETRARGVSITTLCMEGCATECGGCQGDIHRCRLTPRGMARWCVLVADGTHMLAAEIRGQEVQAIVTAQPLIVELAAAYIRQSLALATLAGDLGDEFHGLLSEHARQVLDALHPEGGFFAHLKTMTGTAA